MNRRILQTKIHWKLGSESVSADGSFPMPSDHSVYFPGRDDCTIKVSDQGDLKKNANPAELLLAAVSSSQMISYLKLCSHHNIPVREYNDQGEIHIIQNSTGEQEIKKILLKPLISFHCDDSPYLRVSSIRFINESISHSVIMGVLNIAIQVEPCLEFKCVK